MRYHNTSISSFSTKKNTAKEKDYELLHYFDDQSDDDSEQEKSRSKSKNKKEKDDKCDKDSINTNEFDSSSDDDSKEENFFQYDKDSEFDLNEKVIEKSPDGNYGKVCNNYIYIKKYVFKFINIV